MSLASVGQPLKAAELIQIVAPNGRFVHVNRAWKLLTGYSDEDLSSLTAFDLLDPQSKVFYQEILKHSESLQAPRDLQIGLMAKDGSHLTLTGNVDVLFKNGRVAFAHGSFRDVTGQQRELEAQAYAEPSYRVLIENALDIIATTSVGGNITSLNPAFERITGWGREYWLGKGFAPLVHPDDREMIHEFHLRAVQGKKVPTLECRVLTKLAGYVVMEANIKGLFHDGKCIGVLSVSRDITEKKKLEDALKESEAKFRRLSDASFEGIAVCDNYQIIEANEVLAEMHGYTVAEMIGMSVFDLTGEESRDLVARMVAENFEGAYVRSSLRKDGTKFMVEVRAKSLIHQGKRVRVVAVRDVSDFAIPLEP